MTLVGRLVWHAGYTLSYGRVIRLPAQSTIYVTQCDKFRHMTDTFGHLSTGSMVQQGGTICACIGYYTRGEAK